MKLNKVFTTAALVVLSANAFANNDINVKATELAIVEAAKTELKQAFAADLTKLEIHTQAQVARTAALALDTKVEFLLVAQNTKQKKADLAE